MTDDDVLRYIKEGKGLPPLETPERIPQIPLPQDHKQADELEKIRKELHHIATALDTLIKVESRKGK
jgi:hypothetical protein